jgi:hypothetical protein
MNSMLTPRILDRALGTVLGDLERWRALEDTLEAFTAKVRAARVDEGDEAGATRRYVAMLAEAGLLRWMVPAAQGGAMAADHVDTDLPGEAVVGAGERGAGQRVRDAGAGVEPGDDGGVGGAAGRAVAAGGEWGGDLRVRVDRAGGGLGHQEHAHAGDA